MEFDEFVKRMGESWLSTTLDRLSSLIEDNSEIGVVITTVTVDFELELDFLHNTIFTGNRNAIYQGLIDLLYKPNVTV